MKTRALLAMMAGVALAAPSSGAGTVASDCASIRTAVSAGLNWQEAGKGLEFVAMEPGADVLSDLVLLRFDMRWFRARPFDIRDIAARNQSKGYYAAPLFALRELQRVLPQAALLASGGMTRSFSEPQPAGFLKIDGVTRNRLAPKDGILDGVVCIDGEGRASILSEVADGRRRSPASAELCASGFQAGPVLVADGMPTATEHGHNGARVVFATTGGSVALVAFSTKATTAAIGCALTAPGLGIGTAIRLQGDQLGGAILGPAFRDVVGPKVLGNVDATVASALVIEARRQGGGASLKNLK